MWGRKSLGLFRSLFLIPSSPPLVISLADEAEPNVYDRWDGRGMWCHPSLVNICSITVQRPAEHRTAGGACGCWKGTVPRSLIQITQPSENPTWLPLRFSTSSTCAQGLVCTLSCDTRVTRCKWSDLRVKVFLFLAERVRSESDLCLWFTVFLAAQGLILAPFFNKFIQTRFFKSSHVRPSPL